ncbi:MAG: hypothetical protein IV090_02645 [Candidatus Sericytochromatia bacterium]|nr:hypothetical protein [Candidatus Sericytochromatia bacterium]
MQKIKTSVIASALLLGLVPAALAGGNMLPIVDYLTRHAGQKVTIYGRLTDEIHQHMVMPPPSHQKIAYFRPDIGGQTVIYLAKTAPACQGPLKLVGQVVELRGSSKRPGEPPSKVDQTYVEHQLRVESSLCLPAQGLDADLRLLGLEEASLAQKQKARERLYQGGKNAIPLLIGHLRDERNYEKGKTLPPPLNAPVHASPPPPLVVNVPVSQVASELLYQIITPIYSSAYASRRKVYNSDLFLVKDWEKWWAKNQHKSLAQIHTELKPKVDKYWQTKGTAQILD